MLTTGSPIVEGRIGSALACVGSSELVPHRIVGTSDRLVGPLPPLEIIVLAQRRVFEHLVRSLDCLEFRLNDILFARVTIRMPDQR